MLDTNKKAALIQALNDMVTRIVSTSGLSEQQVIDLITGRIATDEVAQAGTSTTALASIHGAYLVAQTVISDELADAPAGLQSLLNLAAAITAHDGELGDLASQITALGNAFNYVTTLEGGVDAANAFDLDTLPADGKNAGDYYKVTVPGYFSQNNLQGGTPLYVNNGDGIVWNLSGSIDIFDHTDSEVFGVTDEIDVAGSTDTGFTVAIAAAFKARVTALEDAIAGLASGGSNVIPYTSLIPDYSLTTLDSIAPGFYHVIGHPNNHWNLPGFSLGDIGGGELMGTISVTSAYESQRHIHLTTTWKGNIYTRTIRTYQIVDDGPTILGWNSPAMDDNELMVALTDAFNAAASGSGGELIT